MPGGRGTIDEVVDVYLEQVDKVNEDDKYSQSVRTAIVEGIGRIIASSVEPNYSINTYEEGYHRK